MKKEEDQDLWRMWDQIRHDRQRLGASHNVREGTSQKPDQAPLLSRSEEAKKTQLGKKSTFAYNTNIQSFSSDRREEKKGLLEDYKKYFLFTILLMILRNLLLYSFLRLTLVFSN